MRSEARVVVTNPTGLHARPAVKLAQLAARFDAHVEIRAGEDGEWVRARSTARVMKLKAGAQSTIHFRAEGSEADDALSALVEFVRRDFDEGPAATSGSTVPENLTQPEPDDQGASGPPTTDTPGHPTVSAIGDRMFVRRDFDEGPAAPSGSAVPEGLAQAERPDPGASGPSTVDTPVHPIVSAMGERGEEGPAPPTERTAGERAAPSAPTAPRAEEERDDSAAESREESRPCAVRAEAPGERTPAVGTTAREGRTISAVAASPGLAIGIVHVPASFNGASRQAGDSNAERTAFEEAVARAIERLRALADESGGLARDVIGFQVSLLEDGEFLGPVRVEIDAGLAADRAWARHLAREIADYESAPTAYLRDRAADLRDLRARVAMAFGSDAHRDALPENCIVIADELTPSRFLELDRSRVGAVATYSGSTASHVAMLARAHGVPMLVQLACGPDDPAPGAEAIVDADRGCLVLTPSTSVREHYARRIGERRAREREAVKHASRPARTRAGTPVQVLVNVDDPDRLAGVDPLHCDGIGLTRTEFLFHDGAGLPDEQRQLDCYRRLVRWAHGRPVTVRTLDAGGDKPIPGLTLENESNPFLGLRGVRLSLSRPEVFATQLRALARAAAGGELMVMLPMVTKPDELDETRRILSDEVRALRAAGIEAAMPRLGMMVEVPATAMIIEAFDADFFSIGTNDLTQYVLAAGRDSSAVADLLDPLHPAVLELIARVAAACDRAGREVSVCGEMAAQPECLRALLDGGIRAVSVPPAALAATKATVATL